MGAWVAGNALDSCPAALKHASAHVPASKHVNARVSLELYPRSRLAGSWDTGIGYLGVQLTLI